MNNPPAFPRPGFDVDTRGFEGEALREKMAFISEPQSGMTLRDYFAAAALSALVKEALDLDHVKWDATAQHAYIIADTMLKAREQ